MLDSLWSRMLVALGTRVPPAALDSWLRPCRLTAVEGDHIKITAPNPYTRDWLHQHHTESLQAAARDVLGGILAFPSMSTAKRACPSPPLPRRSRLSPPPVSLSVTRS